MRREYISVFYVLKANKRCRWLAFGSKSKPAKLTQAQLLDALHESIFDALQPAEEDYDREAVFQVTSDGHVAPAEDGAKGDPYAFQTVRLDFVNPAANTFKVRTWRTSGTTVH